MKVPPDQNIRKLDAGGGQNPPTLNDALKTANDQNRPDSGAEDRRLAYDVCATVRAARLSGPCLTN
jgi:hypothetical protein